MQPAAVCTHTLAEIEKFTPQTRSWITQLYDGLELPGQEEDCKRAYAHPHEIGYVPAREKQPAPARKIHRGRGSY
jgi:hypothetical protein